MVRSGVIAALFAVMSMHFAHAAAPLRLTVVLSEQGGAYLEYSNMLGAQLANKNVTLSVIDADNPLPDSDLVIAAGMKAATSVARARTSPMLAVLVPREGYASLVSGLRSQAGSGESAVSAIYLDQPLKRQLDLIASVLPRAGTIGVLYATPPKELDALRAMVTARKMELNERSVLQLSNMHGALQDLLISSDVLLALPDAEIYNTSTIRNILLATYRNKVPLIGFSPAYVRAGALCAVFSTPEQIAAQSLAIIQEYAQKHVLPPAQYAKSFEVLVNEQVARSLGINIRSASAIRNEIGAVP